MTITTTQVSGEDALRAVADGKSVQMIWMNDGRPFFSDFTEKIKSAMAIGEAFLIVETTEDEQTDIEAADKVLSEAMVKTGVSVEDFNAMMKGHSKAITFETEGKIADSQQDFADTCENAAEIPETIVTDPDTTPITVEIPNSHRAERDRNHKADQETMAKLYRDGWSQKAIAEELGLSQSTVNYHLSKMSKKGKL